MSGGSGIATPTASEKAAQRERDARIARGTAKTDSDARRRARLARQNPLLSSGGERGSTTPNTVGTAPGVPSV